MWPAFPAGKSAKAEGDFTVVKDMAGKDMWAYKGMPLYRSHDDMKAGDAKGDGKGGAWHVVK
jgi:predicted lipoprotein with Yx(FWY)xxD motif